jgi:hypothetical protein
MNDDRTLERAARSWVEEGPTRAPDRAVEAALSRIQTTAQQRDLVPWRLPIMNRTGRLVTSLAALAVVVALGIFVLRPTSNVGPPQPSPSPTPTVFTSPAATPSDAACRLLTSDEVRNADGNPGLGAQPGASGTDANAMCIYTTGGGDVAVRTDLTNPGGGAAFAAARAKPGVQPETDLGVQAVYDPAVGTMYVLKGDAMAAITPGFLADTAELKLSLAQALARLLIPRL